ncbi:MAG: secD [Micavibrio sp.]|nr:secD [Micavibrio sp.]
MSASMMHIPRWNKILIVLVCILSFAYAAPNMLSKETREHLEATAPGWLPVKSALLGLDLQGGSHLGLQVEMDKVISDRQEAVVQAIRPELREKKISYTRIAPIAQGIRVSMRSDDDKAKIADGVSKVKSILRKMDNEFDIVVSGDGLTVDATLSDASVRRIKQQVLDQSIEIVRRRVDETGTKEPTIVRQGDDRIVLQLPGLEDPKRIKDLLGQTAKLTFHMVGAGTDSDMRESGGSITLPMTEAPGQSLPVARVPILTGDMLTDAQATMSQNGGPVVSFSLNTMGAKKFCDVTSKPENIGKPFAIVLDGAIVSAPSIREPICGGQAQISGQFTLQQTSDLALLLRAGALPAPLHVLEERTVGPSLGADSIADGTMACIMGTIFVIIGTVLAYGLFGVFASVALLINIVMIVALMSMLQATLTLPGIAAIVLTIGMAVDANVLIFERMKEELRAGRSIISALDAGYSRALATITDTNLTTLIAAIILFSFGTGPIKGFAVAMCIGIVTSYFSAVMLTRLMTIVWLQYAKPKAIAV